VRKLSTLLVCAASALTLTATAGASNGGISPVAPVSPNGQKANDAYWLVFVLTAGIFLLVEGALVLFVVRFRSRGRARPADGPDIHGSTKLETAWTIVPVVLLALIATFVFVNLPGYLHPANADKPDALKVHVIAHQFYWEFDYPGGARSFDKMVVPENRLVELTIDSADVIHSWWIPAFGPKTDAIPGQTNHSWFKLKPTGTVRTYKGQCSELCGMLHAKMTEAVEVVPQAQYTSWVSQQASLSPAELGHQEFSASCAKCHGAEAQGFIGPAIAANAALTSTTTLTPIVENGIRTMPPIAHDWQPEQVAALVAYFKSNPFSGGSSGK
jgi:cytochrome c oxidase subunit 2